MLLQTLNRIKDLVTRIEIKASYNGQTLEVLMFF